MQIDSIINKIKNYRRIKSTGYISKSAMIKDSWISGNVVLNDNVQVIDDVRICGNVIIDSFSSVFGPNTQLYSKINSIKIGKFCSIARGVTFQEYNHRISNISTYMINSKFLKKDIHSDIESKGDINICNDVWIGAHSVILSGVKIGNGSVISANSVVTKDIPPYAIVGGCPAKIIKFRFNKSTIELLERLQWWDKSVDWIFEHEDLFQGNFEIKCADIDDLL